VHRDLRGLPRSAVSVVTVPHGVADYAVCPPTWFDRSEEDSMADNRTWDQEDKWWEQSFSSRPYASGRTYDDFRPAYRYGFESGQHSMGRTWNDVEPDLRTGWDKYLHRPAGGSTWEHVKDAVRDAWHRITGQHDLDADKMSESEVDRLTRGGRPR
jgi:hypothetical protein